MIFQNLSYNSVQLIVVQNSAKTKLYTPKNVKKADWLVGHLFNNGEKYTFTNPLNNLQYEPYDIDFEWCLNRNSSLIFSGKIKKQSFGGFFNKLQ